MYITELHANESRNKSFVKKVHVVEAATKRRRNKSFYLLFDCKWFIFIVNSCR